MGLLTTVRVILTAFAVEIAVRMVSLPRLVRWLGFTLATSEGETRPGPVTGTPPPAFDPVERRRVRAVRKVMRHWPFGRGACLRQALLLGHLLRARHPVLHLGVKAWSRGGGREMTAHAWVHVSGCTIGGAEGFLPLASRRDGDDPR